MLTFFFRKKRESAFSIEELFASILQSLPPDLVYSIVHVPEEGANPRVLWKNGFFARKYLSKVNHITGDIYYLAFFLPGKKTILTIHDLRPLYRENRIKRFMLKQLWFKGPARAAGYITVISEATRQDLLKHVPGIADKVYVIPNCLSPQFNFSPKPFNNILPRILHLGTKENKNLERTIQALNGINCHLHIIGSLTEGHYRLLVENNIRYSYSFNLPFDEIIAEYKKADIISFISLQEGFGMPVIEGQAIGRSVITSSISSMPEVAGEGALLVDPFNVEEIRWGMLKLIDDEFLRASLIEKGQENIKRFQPAVVAEQYAQLYRKVIAETE